MCLHSSNILKSLIEDMDRHIFQRLQTLSCWSYLPLIIRKAHVLIAYYQNIYICKNLRPEQTASAGANGTVVYNVWHSSNLFPKYLSQKKNTLIQIQRLGNQPEGV